MEKFKNKKTGVVYLVNDSSLILYFDNSNEYVKVKKETEKKEKIKK